MVIFLFKMSLWHHACIFLFIINRCATLELNLNMSVLLSRNVYRLLPSSRVSSVAPRSLPLQWYHVHI